MSTGTNNYTIAQGANYQGEDWWKWWIWIEGEPDRLSQIDFVVYTLHFSFNDPVRKMTNRNAKFRLDAEGWGIFTVFARLHLKDGTEIPLEHELELEYPDGKKNLN